MGLVEAVVAAEAVVKPEERAARLVDALNAVIFAAAPTLVREFCSVFI